MRGLSWRGFALPRLQARRSALAATLILGVLWALWHLPVFWFHPGLGQIMAVGIVAAVFWVLGLFSQAILYTWLYNSSRRSILMVALLHGGLTTFSLGGGEDVAAIMGLTILIAAVVVIVVAGPSNLGRSHKHVMATGAAKPDSM